MSRGRHSNSQVAESVPFDNEGTDFQADNVQDALTEIGASASPGFSWGRAGGLFASSWLQNEGINSNRTGRLVPFSNAKITRVFVSNEDISTYQITIYTHDGDSVNLTAVSTINVTNSRGGTATLDIPVDQNKQLAVRLTQGNANNILVGVILTGANS